MISFVIFSSFSALLILTGNNSNYEFAILLNMPTIVDMLPEVFFETLKIMNFV